MLEIAQNSTLDIQTNLGKQYLSNESWVDRNGQKIKLVSVTAL